MTETEGFSQVLVPDHIRAEIARRLLPDTVAYLESEQEQKGFAQWRARQETDKKGKERGRMTSLQNSIHWNNYSKKQIRTILD